MPTWALLSIAGPVLAFDLNRPDELSCFIASALILCTAIPAAVDDRIPISDSGSGTVIRLVNSGALPHNLHIPSLDMTVFVPSGRATYVEIPGSVNGQEAFCTIGDHRQLGMTAFLEPT